jgi:hypothetical protein
MDALPLHLRAEAVDDLGRGRLVALCEGKVKLAAYAGEVEMWRVRRLRYERARVDASGGNELVWQRGRHVQCHPRAQAVADAHFWPGRRGGVVGDRCQKRHGIGHDHLRLQPPIRLITRSR